MIPKSVRIAYERERRAKAKAARRLEDERIEAELRLKYSNVPSGGVKTLSALVGEYFK